METAFVCGLRDWKHAAVPPLPLAGKRRDEEGISDIKQGMKPPASTTATRSLSPAGQVKNKTPRTRRFATLVLFAAALFCAGNASYLHAKAALAQVLLQRAFTHQVQTGEATKPWPWADTVPVAKLLLPSHGIEHIVLEGDSGRTLAFGPGWAPASAAPGMAGTTIVSGHRDTHFSFLRDVANDDDVLLQTRDGGLAHYRIAEHFIADSRSQRIAPDAASDELWLVTCWPFDAVVPGGPMRFVARAVRVEG